MPKFLEDKLKAEYGEDSKIPYKVMNSKGYMHGNKTTAKGEALERKHEADVKAGRAQGQRKHRNVQNPRSHHQKLKHG